MQVAGQSEEASPETRRREDRVGRVVGVVLVIALLVPFCVVLFRVVGAHWLLTRDNAGIDVRSRDVFSTHIPLVGAYHGNWSHPGPLMFWVLAPFSTLGGSASATVLGVAVVTVATIALAGWLAWKYGGLWLLLLVALLVALSYRALDPDAPILSVWNPAIAVPFFVLFLLTVGLSVTGRPKMLIAAAAAGSFVVQAHIGYTPLVGAVGIWAIIVVLVDERRQFGTGWTARIRDTALWSLAVAFLLWIGPVVDAVLHRGGNLRRIARFLISGDGSALVGLRRGAELFAAEYRWPPPWLAGHEPVDAGGAARPASLLLLAVPVGLLILGYVAARRSGSVVHRRLIVMAAVLFLAALFALSRATVPALPPYFWWRNVVGLFIVIVTGIAIAGAIGASRRPTLNAAGIVAVVAVIVVTSVSIAFATNRKVDATERDVVAATAMLPTLAAKFPDHGAVLVRNVLDQRDLYGALVDELDRKGLAVRVDGGYPNETEYGAQRTATPGEVAQVWVVAQDGWLVSELAADNGATIVARYSPLGAGDEAELVKIQNSLARTLRALHRSDLLTELDATAVTQALIRQPGIDSKQIRRLEDLNRRAASGSGRRSVVVAVRPEDAKRFSENVLTSDAPSPVPSQ